MAIQIQLRQGTTTEHNTFTGAQGELTYNTTLKSLVLHDGVTAGGVEIPYLSNGYVPSTMLPTATESVVGASKIATTAIAQAGTNDTDIITPLKLSGVIKSFYKTTPVDVTSLRTVGVLYTNPSTTNWLRVTVCFVIQGAGNYYHAQVNGNLVAKTITSGGGVWGENFTFDVPPLGTYKMLGSNSIHFWSEM